ncbi:MAG: oligosaccharide flippase family protein [Pseudomonadota bacterium]
MTPPKTSTDAPIPLSKRLVLTNSASSVISRLLEVTILVWMYQYLLKSIPTEEFAIYPVVMAIMVFAPFFFSLFTGGLARYLIDAYAKSEFERVRSITSSVAPVIWGTVILFWILGLTFAANIEDVLNIPVYLEQDARLMMALLVLTFGCQMMLSPFVLGFHIKQRFVELTCLGILKELLRIFLLLLLLLGIGPAVLWVVIANTIAELAYLCIVFVRSRRMVPELRFEPRLFEWKTAKTLASFGLWTTLGQLGGMMYTNAATILLNLHGTAVEVTSYFLGATLYRQLETLIVRAIGPLLPVITAMNATGDKQRLANTVLRGGRYGLWVSMLVATPAIIYSDIFVELYAGPEFSQASTIIILFMVMFPFTQAVSLLPMTAIATAWVKQFYLPAFLAQLTGLAIMLVMVTRFEATAIGITASLTFVTITAHLVYFWNLAIRMIESDFPTFIRRTLVPGLLPALAGAVVWLGLRLSVPIDGWFTLLLCGFIGAIAYVAALLGFSLEAETRAKLHERLTRSLRS